ncbi:MAG TPA: hypothetical protein VGL61_04435 [Kofleriaceae bacterium]
MTTRELATSPDGQWIAMRDGRSVTLVGPRTPTSEEAPGPGTHRFELEGDDAELVSVMGPPIVFVAMVRTSDATRVSLFVPPETQPTARIELGAPARVAAAGGGRVALVTDDRKEMTLVRAAGRGLALHPVDLGDNPVDFAVSIERNQLVIGQPRKLEVWDGMSGRPLRRLGLELPPPPRIIGAAAGHLWIVRPGTDEVVMYRLSDGRPFRHFIGAPIDDVVASSGSPLIVLVTRRGLVRLHCFAHSLFAVDAPWRPGDPMAQLVVGDDVRLLGWPAGASEPWSVPIGGSTAAGIAEPIAQEPTNIANAAEKLKQMRDAAQGIARASGGVHLAISNGEATTFVASPTPTLTPTPTLGNWREALAGFATEILAGRESELPEPDPDEALAVLIKRLQLTTQASRALAMLYALYLVGEPAIALAKLAGELGDWTEVLGQGQLAALAMLERAGGKVALAGAVGDLLDGAAPREIRIAGGSPVVPRAGAWRVGRDRRGDAEIEAELISTLERIAIVEGRLAPALLEARLHGATAVSMLPPGERPRPWPSGAGLVLVVDHGRTASAWIADVPALPTAS